MHRARDRDTALSEPIQQTHQAFRIDYSL